MKFLDLNGLNHFLTKIKASFGIAIVNNSDYKTEIDNERHINIPFVANHQIVKIDYEQHINVYNWFQGASKGGILEREDVILIAVARMVITTCIKRYYHHLFQLFKVLIFYQRHTIPIHA